MCYVINVSYKGRHFFATAEHSITSNYDLQKVYVELRKKFTEREGYVITATKWEKTGYPVDMSSTDKAIDL